ncbi:MAG: EamA family transporter [Jatrophihabitans sp.]
MAVVLALMAAAIYGVSDFLGGLASRSAKALTVLVYNYPFGALVMAGLLPFFPGHVSAATLAYSCAGGAMGLIGVALLYSALAIAPMNIVSPITAVMTAVVPVVFGVITGERPHALAWFGMVVGLVAVVLISRTPADHPHGPPGLRPILMSVVAGIGFGGYFICLARSGSDSGLWPVVIARVAAAALVIPAALRTQAIAKLPWPVMRLALGSGILDAGANLFFLLATRHGYLSIASVITALYPAGTVALAAWVLHERTGRWQRVGLLLAAGSVVLVAR